ncbi:MAG: RNA polymerase sigma factor [Clostridium sp.]|uniref:RNA polymerase sigma factor n=1 Tax=Clostridium sp. TaxID=1506 RepID=UPI003D6D85B4
MQDITDEKLFLKVISKNNQEAMEIIIHRYNKLIYKFIYSKLSDYYLAQDLCQEVFIKVYEKRDTFNPEYTFKSWIYKIANNCIIDYFRSKEYKNKKQASEVLEDIAITENFNIIEYKMLQNDINDALKTLKENQQEVVTLRFYEDLSLKEISYITESNLNTVKARLYSGIKYLKQALKKDYGGDKLENTK